MCNVGIPIVSSLRNLEGDSHEIIQYPFPATSFTLNGINLTSDVSEKHMKFSLCIQLN